MHDWTEKYSEWKTEVEANRLAKAQEILQDCRKSIPKSKGPDRWLWFIDALQQEDSAWFVMKVFSNHPIPKAMKEAVLSAGLRYGDASTIKFFVVPCVETFGVEKVDAWLTENADSEQYYKARYWLHTYTKSRQ